MTNVNDRPESCEISPAEWEALDETEKQIVIDEHRLASMTDRALAEVLGLHFYVVVLDKPGAWHGEVHNVEDDSIREPCGPLAVTLWLQLKAQVVGRVDDARSKALR